MRKPEPLRVRVIPNTFGQLRVLDFPIGIGTPPVGRPQLLGVVIPAAAPHRARVKFSRFDERVRGGVFDPRKIVRQELVRRPFHHVAVHVVKPPRIGLLLAHLLIFLVTVLVVPGIIAELRGVIPERIGRGRAGSARIFPLRFGGQADRNVPFGHSTIGSICWRRVASC